MAIEIRIDGDIYNLPKMDFALMEEFENVDSQITALAKARAMYKAMQLCFEADELAIMLDGDSIKTIDMVKLQTLYIGVSQAYSAPVTEKYNEYLDESLGMVNKLSNSVEVIKTLKK